MTKETPRLSPSIGAKVLECPLSAHTAHRLLGNMRTPPTQTQIDGTLWHAGITGVTKDIAIIDADSFRSKDAQATRDAALAEGRVPVIRSRWDAMQEGVCEIRESMRKLDVKLTGECEKRYEWEERDDEGNAVLCSGIVDHVDGTHVDDLKTGPGITTTDQAAMLIARSHSILQDAAYRSAVSKDLGTDLERCSMRYVFVQTQPPWSVTPVVLDGEFREVSFMRWRRAINVWSRCLRAGTDAEHWPGPVTTTTEIHAPGWLLAQEIAHEEMAS